LVFSTFKYDNLELKLNIRHGEIDSAYQHELKTVEVLINNLIEEKAKLESKGKKHRIK